MRISKSYCAGSNFSTRDVKAAAALCAGESFNPSRKVDPEMIESVYASLRSTRQRHSVHEMIGEGEWVPSKPPTKAFMKGLWHVSLS